MSAATCVIYPTTLSDHFLSLSALALHATASQRGYFCLAFLDGCAGGSCCFRLVLLGAAFTCTKLPFEGMLLESLAIIPHSI